MKVIFQTLLFSALYLQLAAQKDTEFPKEFIMHAKLHNGMITDFKYAPDLYIGGIQIVPQYTIVEHLLRGGIIADGYYTGKKIQGAVGPTVSVKLKTFKAAPFGSFGNIHLNIDHLWGSNSVKLIGGGINVDLGNKIVLGLTAHREYNYGSWWFQNTLGIRISKTKKLPEL
ncbi:MAG: hypothetical protein QM791_03065 [Ferruginibacter sp.]